MNRKTGQALSPNERDEILRLKELPPDQAIPRFGWYMVRINRATEESRQLARQEILRSPEWRIILSERLESLSQVKTPPDLFGRNWERLWHKSEMTERIDEARLAGFHARIEQAEIIDLLSMLDTPEAALVIAPYLFDQSIQYWHSPDQLMDAPNSIALSAIKMLPVPEKPIFKVKYPDEDVMLRAWREWWVRMAPAFGAEAPRSAEASRAEVALLNSKARPDTAKLKELIDSAIPPPTQITTSLKNPVSADEDSVTAVWVWGGSLSALPVLEWVEIEPSEEEEDANAVVLKGAEAACGRLDGLDG